MTKILALAEALGTALQQRGWRAATAESCTGGLVAAAITSVSGSSGWFDRGFVTYSNAAKTEQLGVARELIEQHGAVSEAVARAMAAGALARSEADVAVAITGVAGPTGGTKEKPVGLVWFAWARRDDDGIQVEAESHRFDGDRIHVRDAATRQALQGLYQMSERAARIA